MHNIKTGKTRKNKTPMARFQVLNLEGESNPGVYSVLLIVPGLKHTCPSHPIHAYQGNIGCKRNENSTVCPDLSLPMDGFAGEIVKNQAVLQTEEQIVLVELRMIDQE